MAGKLADVSNSYEEIGVLCDDAEHLVPTSKVFQVSIKSAAVVDGSTFSNYILEYEVKSMDVHAVMSY